MKGKSLQNIFLASAIVSADLIGQVGEASAYVACNRNGDCWHTDARVHFPGVRLTFHPDTWWHHKGKYVWHDLDPAHDWHHGYWDHGTWHAS